MLDMDALTKQVMEGEPVTPSQAAMLYRQPLQPLCAGADRLRAHFCSNVFDLCAIVNGKSGRCSQDCRFCAQAARHHSHIDEYPLLPEAELLSRARAAADQGVPRYSIVTSGKRLSPREVDSLCRAVSAIRAQTKLSVCVSPGLLSLSQYRRLREAGVSRVHNNLETSRRYFPSVCTTHSYDDKLNALHAARQAGLSLCSGGIMGLGETPEDRIDLAMTLRELDVKSVPVNLLNPIPGTPLEANPRLSPEELRRIVAVFRFLLPDASIRLAGGRGLLPDRGRDCFQSGANAAITGDMLTTAGITAETDRALVKELGYRLSGDHE